MKQKFLSFGFLILSTGLFAPVSAQTVEVLSLSDFTTADPPKTISIRLLEPLELADTTFEAGTKISGDLVDVTSPKRLKKDAGFKFKPQSFLDEDGSHDINLNIIASYVVPLDKGKLAKNAALGVGSYFVKGLSMGVAAVEGAIKNEEGNRFKSSAASVYESSPLSVVSKGEDLYIEENQRFFLKFKTSKSDIDDEKLIDDDNFNTIEKE